jgi:hypothetical protein
MFRPVYSTVNRSSEEVERWIKWIAQGRLVAIYVGSDRRVTSSAIEAFIKASTESRQSEDSDKMETQITAPGQAAFDLATA